jgi:hypothetical protein
MQDAPLPYLTALLILFALLRVPIRQRPAVGLAAGFLLLLAETSRGPHGERLAGPSTGMGILMLIGCGVAFFSGAWRRLN